MAIHYIECPLCGGPGQARTNRERGWFRIQCSECLLSTRNYPVADKVQCQNDWNRRARIPDTSRRLQQHWKVIDPGGNELDVTLSIDVESLVDYMTRKALVTNRNRADIGNRRVLLMINGRDRTNRPLKRRD